MKSIPLGMCTMWSLKAVGLYMQVFLQEIRLYLAYVMVLAFKST